MSFLGKFKRERRAATSVVVALMIVPLLIIAGAAVDFSRVASARAQLQAAVDAAAIAGVGTYKNEQNGTNANSVASAAFKSSIINLRPYSAVATPGVAANCTGTTAQCGAGASGAVCANGDTYCVTVTASASLANSLLAPWIPAEALSVSATAEANANTAGNCPNCVNANSATGIQPGGSSGNLIVSSYHVAGVGSPQSDSTTGNPGGGVDNFNVFVNGNNNALPAANSYVAPTQNSTDPCPANPVAQTITPGASFFDRAHNPIFCPVSGNCTLPGGTYCGDLAVASGVTLTLTGTMSYPAVYIEDGNLLVSPNSTIVETDPTNAAAQYIPIYFGGSNSGSLILQQQTQIDPSGISNGTIEYISTFNSVNVQTGSTTTNLEAGVCEDADSYCTNPITGALIQYSGAGTVQYNDTYITTITISGGAETAWAQTEILAAEFSNTSNVVTSNTTQTVSYSGTYPGNTNLQSSSTATANYSPSTTTPSSSLTCMSGQSQLYYETTTGTGSGSNPNLGYSYASPNIQGDGLLAETINICGVGTALASSGGSGTGSYVGPTGTSSNPVLTN